MNARRKFIQQLSVIGGSLSLFTPSLKSFAASAEPLLAAGNEDDFWQLVRSNFIIDKEIINLNNGGVSPQPIPVQEAHKANLDYCNHGPSYFMWRKLDAGREELRKKMAELAGVEADEIAINRNSTEGLNSVIFGLNLKAGDEVVLTKQDYPNMINAWKQREKRDGIVLKWINLELPENDDDRILNAFRDQMTDKTRIVHVTHMINWVGQILPAKRIADMAHERGAEVLVDAAHTFAHLDYKILDLGADYLATSLHKWLCAPFGSGLLYIKKDKIKNVWALLSNGEPDGGDIRKFESLGTRSFASEYAIQNAIDFHLLIGAKRKEERLRFLKNYWVEKCLKIKGFRSNTPLTTHQSCALFNFSLEGKKPTDISSILQDKYNIHTVGIDWENIHGVRVTPNVYTSTGDLDKLVQAITEIANS